MIQITIPLEQMPFLFKNITDREVSQMYSSLSDFIVALDKNDAVEEKKNEYINVMEAFAKKHKKHIRDMLKIDC